MAGVFFLLPVFCGQGGSPTMSQAVRIVDERRCSYETRQGEGLKSFGAVNFGDAKLGDARRTNRLVEVADAIVRHPGGSLPEKFDTPKELDGLYHLMKCPRVTHASVLAPHYAITRKKIAAHDGFVVALHDTTELDFSTHDSLPDRGQLGNGSARGWLCHNTLIADPTRREVFGLANQILHSRPVTNKKETVATKRKREDRESLLWLAGVKSLPSDRKIVDVCDRGGDTFEFLEHEVSSGRTFVIRSTHSRAVHAVPAADAPATDTPVADTPTLLLHDFARTLPSLGSWTLPVAAAKIKKTVRTRVAGKRVSKSVTIDRKSRDAVLHVSAAPILVCAPKVRRGKHGKTPLPMWVVRVWEPHPPEGVEPLEWMLLTNHPCETFEAAHQVKQWYECRWIIEEYHKGQKTGCGIEDPQFNSSDRLHPMIAILSVVALSLLNLRELSRREDAKLRPATDLFCAEYVDLLSGWRHGEARPDWTIYNFCLALARLGGHRNRKHDNHPGWITLWRGWTKFQIMLNGARIRNAIQRCA